MSSRIFSWQSDLWQRFMLLRDRMPHAVLLHGRQGIGKFAMAQELANALLCESPDAEGFACGQCVSCGWLAQGNHPDFRLIEPDDHAEDEAGDNVGEVVAAAKTKKKSRYILIDQVRALSELVGLTSHRHGLRVVILHPAETLNLSAANALLKMLEEPPPATLFILVTHHLPRLLPTIRSRCHKIAMPVPGRVEAESWLAEQEVDDPEFCLAQSGGAPLTALELDSPELRENIEDFAKQLAACGRIDPTASAAHWSKEDYAQALTALQKWSYDLASSRLSGCIRYYPAQAATLQSMAKSVDLGALLEFQRKLAEARAQANHPLNTELQLEALLVRYSQMFAATARP
jgi:DNA polymerase-3 subunit delta'